MAKRKRKQLPIGKTTIVFLLLHIHPFITDCNRRLTEKHESIRTHPFLPYPTAVQSISVLATYLHVHFHSDQISKNDINGLDPLWTQHFSCLIGLNRSRVQTIVYFHSIISLSTVFCDIF